VFVQGNDLCAIEEEDAAGTDRQAQRRRDHGFLPKQTAGLLVQDNQFLGAAVPGILFRHAAPLRAVVGVPQVEIPVQFGLRIGEHENQPVRDQHLFGSFRVGERPEQLARIGIHGA
jgi:hypothetical protein